MRDNKDEVAFISEVTLDLIPDQARRCRFNMSWTQFSLKLEWALTINKSQGDKLEGVGLMLSQRVFLNIYTLMGQLVDVEDLITWWFQLAHVLVSDTLTAVE